MRLIVAVLVVSMGTHPLAAAESDARDAVARGLKYVADEAMSWKADRKCASCHHIPMAIWTLNEAKARGYAVDGKALSEMTAWALAKDDPGKISPKRPPDAKPSLNQTPLMLALGFEAADAKDMAARGGLAAMLKLVLADQDKEGAWRLMYVWEPHNSTPDVTTTLALLALADPKAKGLGAEGKAALERGLKWLAATPAAETPQADALRLVLAKRRGLPAAERDPLVKRLLSRQNSDGGWGQAKGLKSDAHATGQALYALGEAGAKRDDPAVERGRAFLVKSQKPDGSWEMSSRPGGPGGKSAKNLAPITHVGAAWAVLGLARTLPAVEDFKKVGPGQK